MKRNLKVQLLAYASLFVGVTGAFAIWMTWKKISTLMGDGWLPFIVIWGIVVIGMLTGVVSIKKVVNKLKL